MNIAESTKFDVSSLLETLNSTVSKEEKLGR
jgi:hypothetical protein